MLEAFNRWIVQGSAALGAVDISYAEATLLHIVRLQDRPKSLTTIARLLNRDDTPNIQYGLRKLANAGLIEKKRDPARKTFLYQVTQKGREITDAYARMRREVLMPLTEAIDHTDDRLSAASEFLQIMTGLYDAAGRVAATYQAADHRRRPSANFGKASGKKPV
jgi:predicted MarR family transcription regulator